MDNTQASQVFHAKSVQSKLLKSTSFSAQPGECLCISGPSGSGKSLLLRALADLDVHSGEVLLGETNCRAVRPYEWRRKVAFVPADSQWWHESVADHFTESVDDMFEALGFPDDVMQWEVARLSSGEKQRLALIRALQFKPEVLLLDEPTANTDAENTKKIEKLILDYMREQNAVVIWVSHSPEQIERIADQHIQFDEEQAA